MEKLHKLTMVDADGTVMLEMTLQGDDFIQITQGTPDYTWIPVNSFLGALNRLLAMEDKKERAHKEEETK